MDNETALQFYQHNQSMFLADFFSAGNRELRVAIEQRRDVESGLWFTATWLSYPAEPMEVSAQTNKIMWERVMKAFLADERERERGVSIGREVLRDIYLKAGRQPPPRIEHDPEPVPLSDILHARARPCFTCGQMIDEATLTDGQMVTLDKDRVRHKVRCPKP